MKALQYVEKEQPAVNELPVPEISDDEVLVAARSVGVCHSILSCWRVATSSRSSTRHLR